MAGYYVKPQNFGSGNGIKDEFSPDNIGVDRMLDYFCKDTMERVLMNFKEDFMYISPHNPKLKKHKTEGDLMRSLHWTIHNSAGGDANLIEFFYLNYAKYVELGVQAGHSLSSIGKLPEMTGPHVVPTNYGRPSKPFLHSEIRLHLRGLLGRLAKNFAYVGGAYLFRTVVPEDELPAVRNEWKSYVEQNIKPQIERKA